jgi:acetolactate synthase I/II/III large subunit
VDTGEWQSVSPCAISPTDIAPLVDDLLKARFPLVVTSYLGRKINAVNELVRLCRRLGIGVVESVPKYVNFPADDPLYLGNTWSEPRRHAAFEESDLILVLDSDVPWIPVFSKPPKTARIYHIDVDPLKERRTLWYISAKRVFRADVATALQQINEELDRATIDEKIVQKRRAHYHAFAQARWAELSNREREDAKADVITPEYLTSRIRQHSDGNTIFLIEGVTNNKPMFDHVRASRPGSILTSGGGSLGWNGGAAVGVKMARPEKTVVCLTGDGTYMFTSPSSVHWMSRQYNAPFLQVVYNNRGWRAPKLSTLSVHPEGYASRAQDLGATFDPPPDYSAIAAAAGGAFARIVRHPSEVDPALSEAMKVLQQERRSVVLDVWLSSF